MNNGIKCFVKYLLLTHIVHLVEQRAHCRKRVVPLASVEQSAVSHHVGFDPIFSHGVQYLESSVCLSSLYIISFLFLFIVR